MYRPFLGGKCSGKFIICTKICGNKPIRMFHWPLLFTCLDRGLCFSINSSPFHHWCTTGGHRTNLWRWTFRPSCRLRLLCTLHNPYLCGPVWGPGIAWQSSQLDGLTSHDSAKSCGKRRSESNEPWWTSVRWVVILPAEQHVDASAEDVEPGLLLLNHQEALPPDARLPRVLLGSWEGASGRHGGGFRERTPMGQEAEGEEDIYKRREIAGRPDSTAVL